MLSIYRQYFGYTLSLSTVNLITKFTVLVSVKVR